MATSDTTSLNTLITKTGKLDISQPYPRDLEGMSGHDLRVGVIANNVLTEIFNLTQEVAAEPKGQIPRLLISIRWSLLGLHRNQFSDESNISKACIKSLECEIRDSAIGQQYSIYQLLLEAWENLGVSMQIREQFIDLFLQRESDIYGLYRTMIVEHPSAEDEHKELDKQSIATRRGNKTIPSYPEVYTLTQSVYAGRSNAMKERRSIRIQQASEIWQKSKQEYFETCGLESPLIACLLILEISLTEVTKGTEKLSSERVYERWGKKHGLPQKHSAQLMSGNLIPWESIAGVMKELCTDAECKEMKRQWQEAYELQQQEPTFHTMCKEKRDILNLTNHEIAYALDIQTNDENGKSIRGDDIAAGRISAYIRRYFDNGSRSNKIKPHALAVLVTNAADNETQELKQQYLYERAKKYKRSGSNITDDRLEIRLSREWEGVSIHDVALFLAHKKRTTFSPEALQKHANRIHLFEQGGSITPPMSRKEMKEIQKAVVDIGNSMVSNAVARLQEFKDASQHQFDFREAFVKQRQESGIRNEDLAFSCEVPAIGSVHILAERAGFANNAPSPRACIALITTDNPEKQLELEAQYEQHRKYYYIREKTVLSTVGLSLRILRELNGITADELAKELKDEQSIPISIPAISKAILAAERGNESLQNTLELSHTELVKHIHNMGNKKVFEAKMRQKKHDELPEGTPMEEFKTIADMTVYGINALSGTTNFYRYLTGESTDSRLNIGRNRIATMANQYDYPPLLKVENMCNTCGIELTDAMLLDWYTVKAEELYAKKYVRPLPRMLMTLIQTDYLDVKDFVENELFEQSEGSVTKVLRELENGLWPDWNDICGILIARGVHPNSVQFQYAKYLYEHDDDVKGALKHVRDTIESEKIEINPMNFPGCTYQELGMKKP